MNSPDAGVRVNATQITVGQSAVDIIITMYSRYLVQHRKALHVIAIAGVLDITGGLIFAAVEHLSIGAGLYWALTTATTVGYGDIQPRDTAGRIVAVMVMLTVVPLFAATFSLFTSGLTAVHVRRETKHVRTRLDHIIKHHPDIPDLDVD